MGDDKIKAAERIATEFFKRRFPDKDLDFEKKCGYFGEWVERFRSGSPEGYMDNESLYVWTLMKQEGKYGR